MWFRISLLIYALITSAAGFAQANLEDMENASSYDGEMQFTEVYRKLNLNRASESELIELHLLSDLQCASLIAHRSAYGNFHSLFELQAVAHLDSASIQSVLPYLTVTDEDEFYDFSLKRLKQEATQEWVGRVKGIAQKQAIRGNRAAEVFRYKFSYRRNLWLQVLAENDAGETWNKGPDFLSYSFGIRNFRACKMFVLGDYQLQFGQGLACWSGMGFGKSSATVSIRKTGIGIRPYSSVNESGFFRGFASTWRWKPFEFTPFVSLRKKDAQIAWSNEGKVLNVGADQLTGYHRTTQELLSKGTVRQLIIGGYIGYSRKKFSSGLMAYQEVRRVADYYRTKQVYSLSVQRSLRNGMLFSELANNGGFRSSAVVGVTLAMHPSFSFSALLRNFQSQFQSISSHVFAEGDALNPQSERGCYIGMQWQFSRRSQLDGYVDYSFFNSSRYQVTGSSLVKDRLFQYTFSPDRKSQFYVRLKCKSSLEDAVTLTRIAEPLPKALLQARFNAQIQIHHEWKWHVRVEMNELYMNGELSAKGFLMLNDFQWKRMNFPLSFVLRYAQFNASTWDVRFYAYENDVQYSYSIPAYYGKGNRWYVLLKYQMGRNTDWWVRISNWGYVDREEIGSGLTLINGDQKTECTLQVRIQF